MRPAFLKRPFQTEDRHNRHIVLFIADQAFVAAAAVVPQNIDPAKPVA